MGGNSRAVDAILCSSFPSCCLIVTSSQFLSMVNLEPFTRWLELPVNYCWQAIFWRFFIDSNVGTRWVVRSLIPSFFTHVAILARFCSGQLRYNGIYGCDPWWIQSNMKVVRYRCRHISNFPEVGSISTTAACTVVDGRKERLQATVSGIPKFLYS